MTNQPKLCRKCGASLSDSTKFCTECGSEINESIWEPVKGDSNNEERTKQMDKPYGVEPSHSKQLELKSEGTALVLAILLGLIGLWGIGQIYCSRIGRGIVLLIFGLVIAGFGWSIFVYYYSLTLSNVLDESDNATESLSMLLFLLGSGVIYLGFFFYQIYDARTLARYWNEYVESHNGERPW